MSSSDYTYGRQNRTSSYNNYNPRISDEEVDFGDSKPGNDNIPETEEWDPFTAAPLKEKETKSGKKNL